MIREELNLAGFNIVHRTDYNNFAFASQVFYSAAVSHDVLDSRQHIAFGNYVHELRRILGDWLTIFASRLILERSLDMLDDGLQVFASRSRCSLS